MSVYGTGSYILILEAFLGSVLTYLRSAVASHDPYLKVLLKAEKRIYLSLLCDMCTEIQLSAYATTLRPSIEYMRSHGILTMCPSAATFVIALGPD